MSISIYTKTGCPYCQAAKDWLKSRGKEYEEINLSLCPDKIEEMFRVSGGARKFRLLSITDKLRWIQWKRLRGLNMVVGHNNQTHLWAAAIKLTSNYGHESLPYMVKIYM